MTLLQHVLRMPGTREMTTVAGMHNTLGTPATIDVSWRQSGSGPFHQALYTCSQEFTPFCGSDTYARSALGTPRYFTGYLGGASREVHSRLATIPFSNFSFTVLARQTLSAFSRYKTGSKYLIAVQVHLLLDDLVVAVRGRLTTVACEAISVHKGSSKTHGS